MFLIVFVFERKFDIVKTSTNFHFSLSKSNLSSAVFRINGPHPIMRKNWSVALAPFSPYPNISPSLHFHFSLKSYTFHDLTYTPLYSSLLYSTFISPFHIFDVINSSLLPSLTLSLSLFLSLSLLYLLHSF